MALLNNKNSDLLRRFKFYGFGFLLGLLAVSVIYKGRGCKMPGSVKMEELAAQKLEFTAQGECLAKCLNVNDTLIKQLLKGGKINYDASEVHAKPFPTYAVENNAIAGKAYRILIADCDTISKIMSLTDAKSAAVCDCK